MLELYMPVLTALSIIKSGNLTSFSHYTSPIPLHPPLFSLANLVQPTRLSSIALLLAGYFISSLPPIKDWGIPMK